MKVLYATDGFPAALAAGRTLERIGRRDSLEITVMSVVPAGIPSLEGLPLALERIEDRRSDALAIVDGAVEQLMDAGFRARGHIAEGHPGRELENALEADWYDLALLGAGSRTWLGNLLLGSVSTHLLHASPSSVLIVHEEAGAGPAEIVLGADGSRGAELAARTLAELCDPDRCRITTLAVETPPMPSLIPAPGAAISPPPGDREFERVLLERGHRGAEHLAAFLRDEGFEARSRAVIGHPVEQLLEEMKQRDAVLAALGSRGLGPFKRALIGSVSDQVARHARATLVARRVVV